MKYKVIMFVVSKKAFLSLFLTLALGSVFAQVKLYGPYVSGEAEHKTASYDRSLRLNGMYYYIIPDYNDEGRLYKLKIENHDLVDLSDFPVAVRHAERLAELMKYKFGEPEKIRKVRDTLVCESDTPYQMAFWQEKDKAIELNIDCKDDQYYYIHLNIYDPRLTPKTGQSSARRLSDF